MDYKRIYKNIIKNGMENPPNEEEYCENHHILPKCLGGDNSKENLVRLTGRQHFICHRLLVKIYPESDGLKFALFCFYQGMNKFQRINSREFHKLKKEVSVIKSELMNKKMKTMSDEERKLKYGNFGSDNHFFGKTHSDETKDFISRHNSGMHPFKNERTGEIRRMSSEEANLSDEWVGINKGMIQSEEAKKKVSQFQKGRPKSEETRARMKISAQNRKYESKICPHCGKEGKGPNMSRYHFEKCRTLI